MNKDESMPYKFDEIDCSVVTDDGAADELCSALVTKIERDLHDTDATDERTIHILSAMISRLTKYVAGRTSDRDGDDDANLFALCDTLVNRYHAIKGVNASQDELLELVEACYNS
jgi:hypothetical protein